MKVALFADDVSLMSSHDSKLATEKELQRAVTAVTKWSTSKLMVLNVDKCEVTFFSTCSHTANWQPTTSANNTRLGVKLDWLLTFGPHIPSISTKADVRCQILASLTSKE